MSAYPQIRDTKERVLDHLYKALANYNVVLRLLYPSSVVHREVFDAREGLKGIIMEVENGKFDKEVRL